MLRRIEFPRILIPLAVAIALGAASTARAQEAPKAVWQVGKSSGEVWLTASGVQPASLTEQATLKPGDSIRTGRNGRVLLVRGEESILVAPNSAITVPPPKDEQADGQSTTILQQAGSILLQVEKRNVRNFEVETPYLVAAVKGTEFRVSLDRVDVLKGSVEVADAKSGQHALVFPGQSAKVGPQGGNLSLSGTGVLAPVQKGEPRPTSVQPLSVPRGGLSAPGSVPDGQHVRTLDATTHAAAADGGQHAGVLRISAALGELTLDIHKATNGLAHDGAASGQAKSTVWSSGDVTPGNGVGKSYNAGNNGSGSGTGSVSGASGGNGSAGGSASAGGNGNSAASAVAGLVSGVESAVGLGNGNGNGNAFGLNGGNGVGQALGLLKHQK